MIEPPRWTPAQLKEDLRQAVELFRQERLSEPSEVYVTAFDNYQRQIEELFDLTGDLIDLEGRAGEVVTSAELLEAFRYLGGPPVSEDDLKTLAGVNSLRPSQLARCAADLERVLGVILTALDRRRFPWVAERREPTETERKLDFCHFHGTTGREIQGIWASADFLHTVENTVSCKKCAAVCETSGKCGAGIPANWQKSR